MEDAGTIVLTVLVVAAVTAVLTLISARRRASSWEGTVQEIKRRSVEKNKCEEDQAPITEEQVVIQYRTTAGKNGRFVLPLYYFEKDYSDLKIGDHLVKRKGVELPEKVQGSPA